MLARLDDETIAAIFDKRNDSGQSCFTSELFLIHQNKFFRGRMEMNDFADGVDA